MGNDHFNVNDWFPWVNKEITVGSVSDVTFHVSASGNDNDTTVYCNKGGSGFGFWLRPSDTVQIVSIVKSNDWGGVSEVVQGDPITVTNKGFPENHPLGQHIP